MLNLGIAVNYAEVILNNVGSNSVNLYKYFVELDDVFHKEPLLVDLLTSCYVPSENKRKLFFDCVDTGEYKYIFDFIFNNDRSEYLPLILRCFIKLYRKKSKIGDLLIVSTTMIDQDIVKNISDFVKSAFKLNDVVYKIKVDKSIVSGFKIYIDDKMLDFSIQGFLKGLESDLLLD